MSRRWLLPGLVLLGVACGHGAATKLSPPAARLAAEAASLPAPAYEEEFVDQRMIYQAVPPSAVEQRTAMRKRLISYLLAPLESLSATDLRREAARGPATDDFDRVLGSFKDALELYDPRELWAEGGPRIAPDEAARLRTAAALVVDLFARRGSEAEVALGLAVLATLEPQNPDWNRRLEDVLEWSRASAESGATQPLAGPPPGPRQHLETICDAWPAPIVLDRLTKLLVERQQRFQGLLRRPLGGGARRGMFGDLVLEDADGIANLAVGIASAYARAGELTRGAQALAALAGKPGDDPELRRLVDAAAARGANADDHLALARRFLPKVELLGGTSTDKVDVLAARQVLRLAVERFPEHLALHTIAARVARLTGAPLLALRYLEESEAFRATAALSPEEREARKKELVDLSIIRLKVRMDPEDVRPAEREAEDLRRRFTEVRRELGGATPWLSDGLIDLELARGYVDAGLPDKAMPLFERIRGEGHLQAEVALQLGTLHLRRGQARRAVEILTNALENHKPDAPHETIGFVEMQAKLGRTLGGALELAGNAETAREVWAKAAHAWERLMVEHLRRKNLDDSAEAFVEVGRLYYLLGRRQEGIQKLVEAIEQNESRDPSYIDALSFLVQRGEVDAALDIFRRLMARPGRTVSEYVKTYASLWILDLTRRAGRAPDADADSFLRGLDRRRIALRPPRAAAWYVPLAGYAVGRRSYDDLLQLATNPGRRAELFFYEAQRRLAEGKGDDAHALWNKVLETNMVSFFEFEMASRYLRVGAPTSPPAEESLKTEAI